MNDQQKHTEDEGCTGCHYNTAESVRLLKAAPELLEALKEADETICTLCKRLNPQHKDCTSCSDRQDLLKAITKATGA